MAHTPLVDGVPGTAALFNAVFDEIEDTILAAPGQFAPLVNWTVLGAPAASVTLSAISGSYKALLLRMLLRSSVAATTDTLLIQPNADTTAGNMWTRRVAFTTSTTLSAQEGSGTGLDLGSVVTGNTAPSNLLAPIDFWIFDYANASNPKTFLYEAYCQAADAAASMAKFYGGGVWKGTAAITSLRFLLGSGNLAAGSAYALYEMS